MSVATGITTALKEWAVCERALATGRTILLLRKGGVREPDREFRVDHEQFTLYPTYEHQRADLLKPAFAPLLETTLTEAPQPSTIRLSLWIEVADAFEITNPDHLAALSPFHIWAASYAAERLRWKPRKPLHILLVRAYRLATPLTLPYEARYGGCSSWVDLTTAPSLADRQPVLTDARFAAMAAPIRAALASLPHHER